MSPRTPVRWPDVRLAQGPDGVNRQGLTAGSARHQTLRRSRESMRVAARHVRLMCWASGVVLSPLACGGSEPDNLFASPDATGDHAGGGAGAGAGGAAGASG